MFCTFVLQKYVTEEESLKFYRKTHSKPLLWCRHSKEPKNLPPLERVFAHLTQRRCYLLILIFQKMQKHEKITQKDNRLNDAQLTCGANAIIDLHALSVCVSQQFYLSKKFKKLAYALANEIANLNPKAMSNLKAV